MTVHQKASVVEELDLAELRAMPTGRPDEIRPGVLILDPTHICPFRCPGCIEHGAMAHSRRGALSAGTACRIIEQFRDYGGREVQIYGGEPTVHPAFAEILAQAASTMQAVKVVTNGCQLWRVPITKAIRAAAEQTAMQVRVSLNAGSQETHERHHGVSGYFRHVVEGIAALGHDSSLLLGVSFLVTEGNAADVLDAYRIAARAGADYFVIRPCTGPNSIGMLPLSPGAARAVIRAVSAIRASGNTTGCELRIRAEYLDFLRIGRQPRTAKHYPACWYCGNSRLVVTPPEPGVAWSCTYWRGDQRFRIADLCDAPLCSPEFERRRIEAVRRIHPSRHCRNVICAWHGRNLAIWSRRGHRRPASRSQGSPAPGEPGSMEGGLPCPEPITSVRNVQG